MRKGPDLWSGPFFSGAAPTQFSFKPTASEEATPFNFSLVVRHARRAHVKQAPKRTAAVSSQSFAKHPISRAPAIAFA